MNRTAEIAKAREIDTMIAAEWAKYWEVANKITTMVKQTDQLDKSIRYYVQRGLQIRASQDQARRDVLERKIAELNPIANELREAAVQMDKDLYGGWNRFFLVHHIHSSMHCSSFRPTTRVGWLPQTSGLTEAEAVAIEGETLCTICFPTAPTELTTKKVDPDLCTGSGKYHSTEHLTGRENAYTSPSGYCPDCLRWNTLTKTGAMRKHKVDETRRHATLSAK